MGRRRKISPAVNSTTVTASIRWPIYLRRAAQNYARDFNKQNPGAAMTVSALVCAVLTDFLRKRGALDTNEK
jgi:hypothetical protein